MANNIWKSIGTTVKKKAPEIMLAAGLVGMVTTVVLAVKATPKAVQLLEEAKKERESETEEFEVKDLAPVEKVFEAVKATWKCYIPTILTGIGSMVCLIGAFSESMRRNAALAAACSLSETALKEYRAKVVETIGEKKEGAIRDAVDQEHVKQNPVSAKEVYITRAGETLCYDYWSGRYFKSDVEKIRKAANEVSRRMLDEIYISLNDFYDEIGLTPVKIGDELGWNVNRTGLVELRLGAQLAEGDIPCIVLDYVNAPVHDFMR